MGPFSALLAICAGNSPVPVNSPHNGQWRVALMFSLICTWINDWVNNGKAGDLRRYGAHYDAILMDKLCMKYVDKQSPGSEGNIWSSECSLIWKLAAARFEIIEPNGNTFVWIDTGWFSLQAKEYFSHGLSTMMNNTSDSFTILKPSVSKMLQRSFCNAFV